MPNLRLSNGLIVLVDECDLEWLSAYKWHAMKNKSGHIYAYRSEKHKGKGKNFLMHRQIIKAPKGRKVDHKNGETLDNQRENLRLCTSSNNSANSKSQRKSTSKYKGVSWHTSRGSWRATIKNNGRAKHLGYFQNQEDAARAYDQEAILLFGEFCCPNFPSDGSRPAHRLEKEMQNA